MKNPQEGKTVRTLAVIPARGGSRGVPRKNIKLLCGHPLIYYTIKAAHESSLVDATIVSTDDIEIAKVAESLGADVPFLRPPEFATDTARDIDYLQHALSWVEKNRGWDPEYILFLLPTTPSRTCNDVDMALSVLFETKADSVRTMVEPAHFNPYKMWVDDVLGNGVKPLFPEGALTVPRQELSRFYMPVAVAYATRASLIRGGKVWGNDVRRVPFPLERFVDIDTPADWAEAEMVLNRFKLV